MSTLMTKTEPAGYRWSDLLRMILLIGLTTLLLPGFGVGTRTVGAQDRSAEYANYDVTLDLLEDGSFRVSERMVVSFSGGPFQRGFADIPLGRTAGIGDVTVSEIRDGNEVPYEFVPPEAYTEAPETYTAEVQGTELQIDWAFPPTTSADRTFVVDYAVVGGLRVYENNDPPYQQISWIAIAPEVTEVVPVREASFTIDLPEPVTEEEIEYQPASDPPEPSNDGRSWTWTAANLTGGESLQRSLRFPPMVQASAPPWQAASDAQEAREEEVEQQNAVVNALALGIGLLALVGGGIGLFGLWYSRGRDPHVGAVADFLPEPPSDLPPGVAGTLLDETASEHEFTATMVDLAKRGIIRIDEEASDGFLGIGASRDFDLTLVDPDQPRAAFETDLLQAIFGHSLEKDETVRLSEVKSRVDTARPAILNDLYGELVTRGYFLSSPEATRNHWRSIGWGIAIAAIAGGFILNAFVGIGGLVWLPLVVIALLGIVVVMFSGAFPKKTQAGAEAAARWLAFKRYLESIENYEDLHEAKDIFERYLPFAIAFHLDRSWVQKFAAVRTPVPEWYGDGGPIYVPGTYGPSGPLGRRRYGGGNVVLLPTGGWSMGGGRGQGGGEFDAGGDGGGWSFPDLQGGSDTAGRSLQNASSSLFDLFNSAGSVFGGSSGGSGGWGGGGGFSGGGGGFSGGGGGGGRGFS